MAHNSSSPISPMFRRNTMKKLQTGPGCFSVCCWLVLVCVIPSARSCLQCDLAVRHMHDDFMATQQLTVQQQMDLKKIVSHAYVTYHDTSMQLSGLIDLTSLYRAQTEYQSEFKRHWQEPGTGFIQWDMIQILEKGKRILKQHLEDFVAEGLSGNWEISGYEKDVACLCVCFYHIFFVFLFSGLCPNKCGRFSDDDEFETLVVTKDSKIVLNQLSVREQGVYRCFLLGQHGITLSHIHFILTVTPVPTSPPRLIPTLPSLPGDDVKYVYVQKDTLINIYIFLTVLSMSCSLAIIIHIVRIVRRQKKDEEEDERENIRWRGRDSSLYDIR
ncbi:hypothetical protein Baya_10531 [Bagarius yarrelli]|uniref:Uncharacterized protein n=1 Tax=Bagarius yarrelli TaxID=175774 RepID=A0A556UG91_BAGYA|nr:hypothetical protein Baya_10531 [Bagarius yarrelli]